jgi:hypothetical protein
MSLKLEKIQEKLDAAQKPETDAQQELAARTQVRQRAEADLKAAQEAEAERTRLRQNAEETLLAGRADEARAQQALQARTAERLKWQHAFEAALEE